jgi:hypothetical protein
VLWLILISVGVFVVKEVFCYLKLVDFVFAESIVVSDNERF